MTRLQKIFTAVGTATLLLTALFTTLTIQPVTAALTAPPFPDQRDALIEGVYWLVATHQNSDGGYTAFSTGAGQAPSSVAGTLDAVIAIASAGYNPALPLAGKTTTPMHYLQAHTADMLIFANRSGGDAGKIVLALTMAGQNPRNYLGLDFVSILNSHYDDTTGQYASTNFLQSLAILGLRAVHEEVPPAATQWLIDQQLSDGAWDDGFGTSDNNDATAMAIMALRATGTPITAPTFISATTFFSNSQRPEGGWGYAPSFGDFNANSTALVIQALNSLDEDFYTISSTWAVSGTTPMMALLELQNTTGAFQVDFGTGPFDDFYATSQALVGVTAKPYPFSGRYEAARLAVDCLGTLQDPTTAGWPQFGNVGSDAAGTARAIEAIATFGANPAAAQYTISNTTPISALATFTPDYLTNGGRVGIVMQALVASNRTVTDFAGYNLPISMTEFLTTSGAYAPINFGIVAHTEGMLGLIAADQPVAPSAVTLLQSQVITDDVWGSNDATGIAINALSRLGEPLPSQTLTTVLSLQLPNGGWQGFTSPSVNSTSEIVQGLYAAGIQPYSPTSSQIVSGTVTTSADAIIAAQAESGCWQPFAGDDTFATTDGIIMLMLDYIPPQALLYLPMITQ